MKDSDNDPNNPCNLTVCDTFPELKRLNYCHGQMLGAQDFVDEQAYFLNKIALLTRCLHGYGVVCGLTVAVEPAGSAAEQSKAGGEAQAGGGSSLLVECGVAIDPRGRELVLRTPLKQDLASFMSDRDRQTYAEYRDGEFKLYVTIEYAAHLDGRQEMPNNGCCGEEARTIQNRWHEQPCVRLTFDPPPNQTCDPCCDPPEPLQRDPKCEVEDRLWLAELAFKGAPHPICLEVDNRVRRLAMKYVPTRIKEVNWAHTGVYEEDLAECLLQDGLTITFTAPIDEQSIKNHDVRFHDVDGDQEILTNDIVEVWVCDEHRVGQASPQVLQSQIEILSETQIRVRVKPTRLRPPQRVHFKLRANFILDKCCRSIDGDHHGGLVPFGGWEHGQNTHPEQYRRMRREHGKRYHPASSCAGWLGHNTPASGNGTQAGDFQSWFYAVDKGCLSKYDAD